MNFVCVNTLPRTLAAIAAAFLVACSSEPESVPTAPPAVESAPQVAVDSNAPAVVTGTVPTAGSAPSLVVLEPADGRAVSEPVTMPVMDQMQLTFVPSVLFVRTGHRTEFRNSDPELHNIRVREEATRAGTFNVAIPTGETFQFTFERDGFYDVGCDIHPGMSAMIIATRTPFTAVADSEGRFTIADVPPGSYNAVVQMGGSRVERTVVVTGGQTELDLTDASAARES